jgi:hypothetical protein
MIELKEQNKQIEKAKDDFQVKIMIENFEKQQEEEKAKQELLNEIKMKNEETMNLKTQYEIDINNYKKQL